MCKGVNLLKLPYLQNDKEQDGRSTNVCFDFSSDDDNEGLAWASEVGREAYCNISTHYIQNNSSFTLFKHEAIIVHSVSLLYFRSQNNTFRSIQIPWLSQHHRPTVTVCLLDYGGITSGVSERLNTFPLPQNMQNISGIHLVPYCTWALSRFKAAGT